MQQCLTLSLGISSVRPCLALTWLRTCGPRAKKKAGSEDPAK
jgi:hypothetical protein